MAEDFLWAAHYSDGSVLSEAPGLGFASIDLTRLVALELLPQRAGLPNPHVAVGPGARPIFFRRRAVEKDLNTGEEWQHAPAITVLGWQATVGGRNVKSLCAFFHDGSIKITDDEGSF